MLKRITTFFALLIAAGAMLISNGAQAQTKHVLMEEFTGAWCGFCPQGIWAIQNLDSIYGDKFIPVAFHDANSEPMETPTGRDTMSVGADGFPAISGYPDAWIDRTSFDGTTWSAGGDQTGRYTIWRSHVDAELANPVDADVAMSKVSYDPTTRQVSVDLGIKFYNAVSGDIRLNVYLIEDSVSGPSGSSYDQHNYLANGGYPALDPTSPWHSYLATIPLFQHMHVMREAVGGAWGIAGVVPASVSAGGNYTQTFKFALPAYVHAEHASLVGFAFYYNSGDITSETVLNAAKVKLTNLPSVSTTIANGFTVTTSKAYINATPSGATTQPIIVRNSTTSVMNVGLAYDPVNSGLSPNWTVSISPATLSVPAGGTATATATFNAPANAGYSLGTFAVWPQVVGEVSVGTEISIGALSTNTKYLSYGGDGNIIHGMPPVYANSFATIPLNVAAMAAYPATNYDVGIFPNVAFFDYGNLSGPPPPVITEINSLLNANKKVFITSTAGMFIAFDPNYTYHQYTNTAAEKTLFSKLGVKYVNYTSRQNQTNGALIAFEETGFDGNPIGNGIDVQDYSNQGLTDIYEYTNSNSKPAFYSDGDSTVPSGFTYESGEAGQRLVYLDMCLPYVQDLVQSDSIVTRSMRWLLNGSPAAVAQTPSSVAGLTASPNPFTAATNIRYIAAQNESSVQMSVIDVLGREVAKLIPQRVAGGTYTATLAGSDLAAGSYHVVVRTSEGMHTLPVMITR